MATSAERKALNEGTFRDSNERLERAAVDIIGVDQESPVPFLCECPQMDCAEVVLLTLREYERVRSGSRQGLAALGHEDLSIEVVLERNDRFVMTEKFGAAGKVHLQTDERGND
jgi:hypothetical protein